MVSKSCYEKCVKSRSVKYLSCQVRGPVPMDLSFQQAKVFALSELIIFTRASLFWNIGCMYHVLDNSQGEPSEKEMQLLLA